MFKKFFDFSISGILLTIGLGMYLTGLIIFGLSNVAVFCLFSAVLCFGMSFYVALRIKDDNALNGTSIAMLLMLSLIFVIMAGLSL